MEPEEYERVHRLERTHFYYRGLHALILGALGRHLPGGAREPRVLDAGCGTGGLLERLAGRARAVGVDLSPLALDRAREASPGRLARADVGRLPFRDGVFDAAVSADVLYHRDVEDDDAALAELARVCRPGGVVVLTLAAHPRLRGHHDRVVHTRRRYARDDVRALAASAELQLAHLGWFNAALLPAAVVVRTLSRDDAPARSDVRALPALLNAPLSALLRLEAAAAQRGLLPWGLAHLAVLRKPGAIAGPVVPC